MVTNFSWKEITDEFVKCSLCHNHLKEPKLLSCLHRFCLVCLGDIVEEKPRAIECPICGHKSPLPTNEKLNGLKTDHQMKAIIELLQLLEAIQRKAKRKCIGCSKELHIVAYCFKCHSFLCENCYKYHMTNKMLSDHKRYTFKSENGGAEVDTLEMLTLIKETPRCHNHFEKKAQLCCSTCENLPVCETCTYTSHMHHDLHDVKLVAKTERKKIHEKLELLLGSKDITEDSLGKLENLKMLYLSNVSERRKKVQLEYEELNSRNIETLKKFEIRFQRMCAEQEKEFQHELNKLREEYENKLEAKRKENEKVRKCMTTIYKEGRTKRLIEFDASYNYFAERQAKITKESEYKIQQIESHSNYFDQTLQWIGNFITTSRSILAAKDDWTAAQCLPDVYSASELIVKRLDQNISELYAMHDSEFSHLPHLIRSGCILTIPKARVVDLHGIKRERLRMNGMANGGDGRIILTGVASSDTFSHISFINIDGESPQQEIIAVRERTQTQSRYPPFRYSASLSSSRRIATVCCPNEIGIFDMGGEYIKKDIRDNVQSWPDGRWVSCIATTPVSEHIFVGTNSRDVYVFDRELRYCHTLTLPEEIRWPRDICVHRQNLLVCNWEGRKAYAITMGKSDAELAYELIKPDCAGGDWRPWSVCTDINGFIYMLWDATIRDDWRVIMVRYSQDGSQLLTVTTVDEDARCLVTMETEEGVKLLVGTESSGKVYVYDR